MPASPNKEDPVFPCFPYPLVPGMESGNMSVQGSAGLGAAPHPPNYRTA